MKNPDVTKEPAGDWAANADSWMPHELRGDGPQPEDYQDWDDWVWARRMWVAKRMMGEQPNE